MIQDLGCLPEREHKVFINPWVDLFLAVIVMTAVLYLVATGVDFAVDQITALF